MKRKQQLPQVEENTELDMAPMLALMVTLIPILLLSSAFVHIMVAESSLPQLVAQAVEENKDTPTKLSVYLAANNRINIELKKSGSKPQHFAIQPVANESGKRGFDYKGLNVALSAIKTENPDLFRAELFPDDQVNYADVMLVMDELRHSKSATFPIPRPDGSQMQSDVMFPDVVFGNILEDS